MPSNFFEQARERGIVAPFAVADSGKFTISYIEQGLTQKSVAVNYIAERDYVFTL